MASLRGALMICVASLLVLNLAACSSADLSRPQPSSGRDPHRRQLGRTATGLSGNEQIKAAITPPDRIPYHREADGSRKHHRRSLHDEILARSGAAGRDTTLKSVEELIGPQPC